MKKRTYIFLLLCILSWIQMRTWGAGGITHTIRIDRSDLRLEESVENGLTFIWPCLEGYGTSGAPGSYAAPGMTASFSVPANSHNYRVILTDTVSEIIRLDHPVKTIEREQSAGMSINDECGSGQTPFALSSFSGESFLGGFNKIVGVDINPVEVLENGMAIRLYTDFTVNVSWDITSDIGDDLLRPVFPLHEESQTSAIEETKEFVINPADVEPNMAVYRKKPMDRAVYISGDYEYIIVTSKALRPAFQRLESMRKLKGYKTGIFCMEDILDDSMFAKGDEISGLNDDAGKLRAFLTYMYRNHKTKYVLLGGDYSVVPIRFERYMDTDTLNFECEVASDLYYGELNSSWKYSNGYSALIEKDTTYYFKPIRELHDFNCELYIGRLPCNNKADVENYLNKLFLYELNPGNGDGSYLDRAFVSISKSMFDVYNRYGQPIYRSLYKGDNLKEIFQPITDNDTIPTITGKEVIQEIKHFNSGFIDFRGHGAPDGVSVCENATSTNAVTALDNERAWFVEEKGNALDSLNNYYYPNWSHSMSCTLTPLQSLQRYVNNLKNLSMTFVQSYILGKHYGGIAFFGNTGAGYVEYSDKFQELFFINLLKENQNQNTLSEAGKIGALTKQSYNGGSEHDLKTRHTLIGDPMINLWIHNPSKISGKSGRPSPELVPDSITNLFIASYNIKDNTVTRSTVAPFMLEMLRCPDNTIATVFGNNVLPAIMPLNIRNITFTGSKTITANNIQIGSDVIFSNGSNVEIYALGDITIGISNGNEPRFLNNSRVTIHTPGNVKISDVRIAPGAVLDIHAGNLELGPNFTLPLGAELHYEKSVYN
jgi:hypothetical protein